MSLSLRRVGHGFLQAELRLAHKGIGEAYWALEGYLQVVLGIPDRTLFLRHNAEVVNKRYRIFNRHSRLQTALLLLSQIHGCALRQDRGSSGPANLPLTDVFTPHCGQLGDKLFLRVSTVALVRCLVVGGLVYIGLRYKLAPASIEVDACLPAIFAVTMALLPIVSAAACLWVLDVQLFVARELQHIVCFCL